MRESSAIFPDVREIDRAAGSVSVRALHRATALGALRDVSEVSDVAVQLLPGFFSGV